jgi:hypothetical protein
LQDDEIDLATYLKTPPVPGKSLKKTAGVKWKAHWLAVEGVQPAIPENPIIKDEGESSWLAFADESICTIVLETPQ